MATNMYGIDSRLWAQMSPEDQNQVIAEYNQAHGVSYAPPTIGGYVPPTPEQVDTAVQGSGLPDDSQKAIRRAYDAATGVAAPAPAGVQNPSWVYAVNMPSTYPDFAAMKAAGAGIVLADDDPNFAILLAGARQWGIQVAIQVNAPPGITPEEYAAKVAQFQQFAPDKLVLDIEAVGNGDPGSAGWNWSTQAAALLKPVVGDTSVAVTMEPHKSDYNYQAFQGLSTGASTEFWVQTYVTNKDGTTSDVEQGWATGAATAAVGDSAVVAITRPNVAATSGGKYVSYGIPQNGASAAGIYGKTPGPGVTPPQNPANTPPPPNPPNPPNQPSSPPTSTQSGHLTPVGGNATPAHGHGGAPAIPGEIPETGPTPPGSPAPPGSGLPGAPPVPGTSSGTGSAANKNNTNWAAAYFASFGLPPDVAAKVNEIFQQYPDTDQAIQFALAYIRGTPWYAQTFPGIKNGMQHGLVSNEQEYRQYVTGIDTLAQRYLGRHISGTEIADYLYNGLTPEIVGKQYEGQANLEANFKDYAYYTRNFGDQDVQNLDTDSYRSLANEQVGLDSPLGQKLNKALQTAMQRAQKAFEGQTATPSLSLQNGLSSPSLLGRAQKPDVAA